MFHVDRPIHGAHRLVSDAARKAGHRAANLWMGEERGGPDDRHRIIGREIPQAVVERQQIERVDLGAGRITGDDIHLPIRERFVNERQVHRARRGAEPQPVRLAQPGVAIRALEKLVAESRRPACRHRPQVGDRSQPEPARIARPHENRKRVVESERLEHGHAANAGIEPATHPCFGTPRSDRGSRPGETPRSPRCLWST